ncbi:MAG TPA: VWA domain-containing protein [Crenotrichaceae bacterium]|nr:VWA domain-containing protein [Crenotrichaceae bacterium]
MKRSRPLLALKRHQQIIWLLLAIFVTAFTFISPTAQLPRQVIDVVFIVDITQSMNARDVQQNSQSITRLQAAKHTIQNTLKHLPCGSHIGIGIFAAKDALLLFNPIELCEHYSLLSQVVSRLSWRMAWAGDSNIQRGLYSAIGQVAELDEKPTLVFFTDGEQTISEQYAAPLHKRAGKIKGLIIGVGGNQPVRIPKFNTENEMIGYWKSKDVGNKKPMRSQSSREDDYLSQLDENRLRDYASLAKLKMQRLDRNKSLTDILFTNEYTRTKIQTSDIRWILAIAALAITLLPYLFTLLQKISNKETQ